MDLDSLQPIKITINDYIDNPMGNRSNTAMNLKMVQDQLDERYTELLQKKKKFKYTIYKDEKSIFIHVLLPSEKYNMAYDVVIEIDKSNDEIGDDSFKVYSNSPSFVFTYAYIFNTNNLLIDFLKKKYDKKVLSNRPVQRNYYGIVSYEKSIYFTLLYILSKYQTITSLDKKAKKINKKDLYTEIHTPEFKIDEFNKLRKIESRKNKTLEGRMKKAIVRDLKKRQKVLMTTDKVNGDNHIIKGKSKIIGKPKIKGKTKLRSKIHGKNKIK